MLFSLKLGRTKPPRSTEKSRWTIDPKSQIMYNTTTFAKTFGASLGLMLLVAAVGVYGGLAYAVPVSGVGGFTVTADTIEGDDAVVYPSTGDTSEAANQEMAVVELQSTTIENLRITKTVNLPAVGEKQVVITAEDTVKSDQMLLKSSNIYANGSELTGLSLDESPSGEASQEFVVKAGGADDAPSGQTVDIQGENPGLFVEEAELQTHYLVTNQISIPGLSVTVEDPGQSSKEADGKSSEGQQQGNSSDSG